MQMQIIRVLVPIRAAFFTQAIVFWSLRLPAGTFW